MDFHDRDQVDARIAALFADDPALADLLVSSLGIAAERAAHELDVELRDALPWPTTVDAYADYLVDFARWIPQESGAGAWRGDTPRQQFSQEISDRLAHFFWLVDQHPDGDDGAAERSQAFGEFLTEFAASWGAYLDTAESFGDQLLGEFGRNAPQYTIEESLIDGRPNAASGWQTFNQFFARELNAGLRPVAEPTDNHVLACPADCSYEQTFGIGADSQIPRTRLKGAKTYGDVASLLGESAHAAAFAGGTFVHYMLPPSAYHRFHAPVSGRVDEAFVVQGRVYMQVDVRDGRLQSLDRTESGYEFFQTRGVVVLDTASSSYGDIGLVAVVPVGMSHVASVRLTAQRGVELAKGDEFGFFQFGGSDIIVLLQAGVEVEVDTGSGFRHFGSAAARAAQAGGA